MTQQSSPLPARIELIEYQLPDSIETGITLIEQNPEWSIVEIEKKTGINTRYISDQYETALDLGLRAANKILTNNENLRAEIDVLIFVTQSPDYALPASACILQEKLNLKTNCMAFDVNQGCSGFIYGMALSSSLITAGLANKVLLVCADTYSKYIAPDDRTCRPIFSDGAAATLIASSVEPQIGPFELGTDGKGALNLIVENGGARQRSRGAIQDQKLFMDGAKVFMFSMSAVPKCVENLLHKTKKSLSDIDLFVFHQASKLVLDNIIRHLSIPAERVYCNYSRIGNTVSASIPIALKDALDDGALKHGDLVMVVGFGVGYSWGASLLRWGAK